MKYVKNLVKILVIVQCLLFCTCNKKEETTEIETTEQNELNLADFVKCPFKDEFDDKTNLEKYVLKKFGKPKYMRKWRAVIYDNSEVIADQIQIAYKDYSFEIHRGVYKRFEVFKYILILEDFQHIKYGINKETITKDIKRLFGRPERIKDRDSYFYSYSPDGQYSYHLNITFIDDKIYSISIEIKM